MGPEHSDSAGDHQLLKLRFSWWGVAFPTALGVAFALMAYHGWRPQYGRFSRGSLDHYRAFMAFGSATALVGAARFAVVPAVVVDLAAGEATCRFVGTWSRRVPTSALRVVADGWYGLPAVEIRAGAIRTQRILVPCRLADYRAADRVLARG